MCVLLCGVGEVLPSEAELERGALVNPDGFGWGIVSVSADGHGFDLATHRTMSSDEAVHDFPVAVAALGDRVVCWAWHARIATSGGVNLSGCHPHVVNDSSGAALFHNGILPITPVGGLSDTATFARDLLPALGGVEALDIPVVVDMLEEWATGSKLVILSTAPGSDLLTILNEDAGQWVGDIWYSNSSCWAPARSAGWGSGFSFSAAGTSEAAPVEANDSGEIVCVECWHNSPAGSGWCVTCGLCLDCEQWDCLCVPLGGDRAPVAAPGSSGLSRFGSGGWT